MAFQNNPYGVGMGNGGFLAGSKLGTKPAPAIDPRTLASSSGGAPSPAMRGGGGGTSPAAVPALASAIQGPSPAAAAQQGTPRPEDILSVPLSTRLYDSQPLQQVALPGVQAPTPYQVPQPTGFSPGGYAPQGGGGGSIADLIAGLYAGGQKPAGASGTSGGLSGSPGGTGSNYTPPPGSSGGLWGVPAGPGGQLILQGGGGGEPFPGYNNLGTGTPGGAPPGSWFAQPQPNPLATFATASQHPSALPQPLQNAVNSGGLTQAEAATLVSTGAWAQYPGLVTEYYQNGQLSDLIPYLDAGLDLQQVGPAYQSGALPEFYADQQFLPGGGGGGGGGAPPIGGSFVGANGQQLIPGTPEWANAMEAILGPEWQTTPAAYVFGQTGLAGLLGGYQNPWAPYWDIPRGAPNYGGFGKDEKGNPVPIGPPTANDFSQWIQGNWYDLIQQITGGAGNSIFDEIANGPPQVNLNTISDVYNIARPDAFALADRGAALGQQWAQMGAGYGREAANYVNVPDVRSIMEAAGQIRGATPSWQTLLGMTAPEIARLTQESQAGLGFRGLPQQEIDRRLVANRGQQRMLQAEALRGVGDMAASQGQFGQGAMQGYLADIAPSLLSTAIEAETAPYREAYALGQPLARTLSDIVGSVEAPTAAGATQINLQDLSNRLQAEISRGQLFSSLAGQGLSSGASLAGTGLSAAGSLLGTGLGVGGQVAQADQQAALARQLEILGQAGNVGFNAPIQGSNIASGTTNQYNNLIQTLINNALALAHRTQDKKAQQGSGLDLLPSILGLVGTAVGGYFGAPQVGPAVQGATQGGLDLVGGGGGGGGPTPVTVPGTNLTVPGLEAGIDWSGVGGPPPVSGGRTASGGGNLAQAFQAANASPVAQTQPTTFNPADAALARTSILPTTAEMAAASPGATLLPGAEAGAGGNQDLLSLLRLLQPSSGGNQAGGPFGGKAYA